MNSTDHNINNPLGGNTISLLRTVYSTIMNKEVKIRREDYDIMPMHDPFTLYVISDSKDNECYLGDTIIKSNYTKAKYFIGQERRNEYIIFKDQEGDHISTSVKSLIPICRYSNPQDAINALSIFNKIGSHNKLNANIYNILTSYINKNISTHDFIISIIAAYNFKEDPRLQRVIQFNIGYNMNKCEKEFNSYFVLQLGKMRDAEPDSLFPLYSNLYDLLVRYNFFKDKKYDVDFLEDLDLSDEVSTIISITNNTLNHFKL